MSGISCCDEVMFWCRGELCGGRQYDARDIDGPASLVVVNIQDVAVHLQASSIDVPCLCCQPRQGCWLPVSQATQAPAITGVVEVLPGADQLRWPLHQTTYILLVVIVRDFFPSKYNFDLCRQCFHTVGWVAGRASGL